MSAIAQYTQPHQFEPLLPQRQLEALRERSRDVVEQSYRLAGSAHPDTVASLRELVREMNSYYSNRIEGQNTHPRQIERALRQDFSSKPEEAKLQRIALAHIEAERELEALVRQGTPALSLPLSSAFLLRCHAALYGRLQPEDRTTEDGRVVMPGALRNGTGRGGPP
jgi:Fic family protein